MCQPGRPSLHGDDQLGSSGFAAFHNAKSMEGMEIRKALLDFDGLKCVTGLFTFDINGNVVRSVTLSTIKDGKPVTEYITKTEAEARELEDLENVVSEGSGS